MTLKPITISVHVPARTALARGESQHGDTTVALSDVDVASMSTAARELLASSTTGRDGAVLAGGLVLPVERADGPSTVHALEMLVAEIAESAAKRAAEDEKQIQAALAAPDGEWIGGSSSDSYVVDSDGRPAHSGSPIGRPLVTKFPRGAYLSGALLADPRIVAHRARIERDVLPGRVTEWERGMAEWRAWDDARKAKEAAEVRAKVEAKEACVEALRGVARGIDDLARAAADGYDVTGSTLSRLAGQITESVGGGMYGHTYHHEIDDHEWDRVAERQAPRPEAFALRDKVEAAVRSANERLPVAVGKWTVSRIVRVDVCPHAGQRHNVTAVLATLATPCGMRQVTFSTEPLSCSHDGDDAEE